MDMVDRLREKRRGSIALARSLCVEIHGFTDENEDFEGNDYGSVDVAEILSAEILRLRERIAELEGHNVELRGRAL